jgi:hypothetical protein
VKFVAYAPEADHEVDRRAVGFGCNDDADTAEVRNFRRGGIINPFLIESVTPARYLKIAGRYRHGQSTRPSLIFPEDHMARLWRTFVPKPACWLATICRWKELRSRWHRTDQVRSRAAPWSPLPTLASPLGATAY